MKSGQVALLMTFSLFVFGVIFGGIYFVRTQQQLREEQLKSEQEEQLRRTRFARSSVASGVSSGEASGQASGAASGPATPAPKVQDRTMWASRLTSAVTSMTRSKFRELSKKASTAKGMFFLACMVVFSGIAGLALIAPKTFDPLRTALGFQTITDPNQINTGDDPATVAIKRERQALQSEHNDLLKSLEKIIADTTIAAAELDQRETKSMEDCNALIEPELQKQAALITELGASQEEVLAMLRQRETNLAKLNSISAEFKKIEEEKKKLLREKQLTFLSAYKTYKAKGVTLYWDQFEEKYKSQLTDSERQSGAMAN